MDKLLNIVIPAAGFGQRISSYGTKSMLKFRGEHLIQRQIRVLHNKFPSAKITIVSGFQSERIQKVLPNYVNNIINQKYETTNVGYSIDLGLRYINDNVLIVYSDLIFNEDVFTSFEYLSGKFSYAIVDHNRHDKNDVGTTLENGRIRRFDYGLSPKWSQIIFLSSKEIDLFKTESCKKQKDKYFTFELLNDIINNGGNIFAIPLQAKLAEIDCIKDLELADEII